MATLRKGADVERIEALAGNLAAAERELRAALGYRDTLTLRRAGQLVEAIRRIQLARLELDCEALDSSRRVGRARAR